jgi:diguanylate cyclase (GGDEF)-like protein
MVFLRHLVHVDFSWKRRIRQLEHRVEELRFANAQLKRLAMIDPLTSLPNRRALKTIIDLELMQAERYNRSFVMLLLDLNGFKLVNDTYGHTVGDDVLQEFVGVVRTLFRQSDIIGRWGGDEFLALLPDIEEMAAQQVVNRIRIAVAEHFFNKGAELHLTCSIGIAMYPLIAQTSEQLIAAADEAMYKDKHNHVSFPDTWPEAEKRMPTMFDILEKKVGLLR